MTEDQRMAGFEARLEQIDQHGTRGMEGVRAQLGQVQRDLGKMESSVDRIETAVQTMQLEMARTRPGLGAWVRDLALIAPMYALVVDLIVRGIH
jgi:hypothetical protein